jgi:hypothetical protein
LVLRKMLWKGWVSGLSMDRCPVLAFSLAAKVNTLSSWILLLTSRMQCADKPQLYHVDCDNNLFLYPLQINAPIHQLSHTIQGQEKSSSPTVLPLFLAKLDLSNPFKFGKHGTLRQFPKAGAGPDQLGRLGLGNCTALGPLPLPKAAILKGVRLSQNAEGPGFRGLALYDEGALVSSITGRLASQVLFSSIQIFRDSPVMVKCCSML